MARPTPQRQPIQHPHPRSSVGNAPRSCTNRRRTNLTTMRPCQMCDQDFESAYPAQRFCSRACAERHRQAVRRAQPDYQPPRRNGWQDRPTPPRDWAHAKLRGYCLGAENPTAASPRVGPNRQPSPVSGDPAAAPTSRRSARSRLSGMIPPKADGRVAPRPPATRAADRHAPKRAHRGDRQSAGSVNPARRPRGTGTRP